ncbi:hypothetical protein [Anabaena sp. PCC 7108]|uniref:hypothetical protein n=1 Tax=Anabaena sp. PCC 7108 TaxID=163908 RepID=UPI000347E4DA|nr:hypothetical protein [Anabaena sp. PCC 7108]
MERQKLVQSGELHTSLTVDIDGSLLPFDKFRKAQEELANILHEVDQNLGEKKRPSVNWVVSSVTSGSVHLTIEGVATDRVAMATIAEVVTTVEKGIATLEEYPKRPPFFSDRALASAKCLASLIGEDILTIQVGSNSTRVNLTQHLVANVDEIITAHYKSFGSVEGVLKAIDLSRKPLFRIYDLLTGKGVKCHFIPERIDFIKDALGKRVSVYGLIRSREDGQKVSVEVEDMEVFPIETQLPSIKDIIGILGGKD